MNSISEKALLCNLDGDVHLAELLVRVGGVLVPQPGLHRLRDVEDFAHLLRDRS